MSILQIVAMASAVTLVPTASDEPRKARVEHQDLNLASATGQDRLDRRLKTALNMVCGRKGIGTLAEHRDNQQCRNRALAEIAPQRQAAIQKAGGVRVASKF